jgi:hypothetical protein
VELTLPKVEDSNLITSYAVSPETYFDAAPCSICCKRSKQIPTRRLTYAASRSSRSSKTVKISCFEAGSQESGYSSSKPASQNLPSPAPVTLVDVLSVQQVKEDASISHQVLVLQNDGKLSCFSEKVGQSLWSTELNSLPSATDGFDLPEEFQILHAELVSLGAASHGILRGRQDVLAGIDAVDCSILTIIGTSPSVRSPDLLDVDMHIYCLRSSSSSKALLPRALPQQLLSWTLSQPIERASSVTSTFCLVSTTGSLIELNNGYVSTYDLSGLSPKVVDTFTSRDRPEAVTRISPSLVLSVSLSKYAIHDSKYGSLLSSYAVPLLQTPPSKKEHSLEDTFMTRKTRFIGYFARSGIAIALRGNNLITIQIGESARTSKRQKTETLLIDSLAKGLLGSRMQTVVWDDQSGTKKRKRTKISSSSLFSSSELDALIENGQLEEFEKQFAALVDFGVGRGGNEPNGIEDSNAVKPRLTTNVEWNFPSMHKLHNLPANRPRALYALSKIFEPINPSSDSNAGENPQLSSVRMKLYPENTFLWLVRTSQLRADLIQRALIEYVGFDGEISHGDMIKALAEFDGDLALVHYVLMYHPNLHVDELVLAVQTIVKSLDHSTLPQPEHRPLLDDEFSNAAATTGALTNGVGLGLPMGKNVPTLDGQAEDGESEGDIQSVTDAALRDLDDMMDQAYETLDNLVPIRGEALRQALTKLNALPIVLVTETLRARLTQHELIFLIHILRIELDQGGWTTRYVDDKSRDKEQTKTNPETGEEPSNRAITVVANMLSCAVDAIGMSGWLAASTMDPFDSIDKTLALLRGEISNTLEGVHEATFINGVLSDLLRHHYKRENSEHTLPQARKTVIYDAEARKKEEALWREGKTVIVEKEAPPHLPIGLGMEGQGVKMSVDLHTKTLHGGIKKKRMADVGREIRRGLPQYVFERIRF